MDDRVDLQIENHVALVRINRLVPKDHATVLAKCEFFNPLASVKPTGALTCACATPAKGTSMGSSSETTFRPPAVCRTISRRHWASFAGC